MDLKKNSQDDCALFGLTHLWKVTVVSISYDLSCIELFVDYNHGKIVCPACGVSANVVSKGVYTLHISEIKLGLRAKLAAYVPIIGLHNKDCNSQPLAISNTFLLDIIIKIMGNSPGNNPFLYLFNAVAGHWQKPRSEVATIPANFKSF